MRKILVILIIGFMLCGCGSSSNVSIEKIMKENEHIIIDVRTKDEYEEEHIKNAINIPYDEINSQSNIDKEKIIFVYCRSGNRSKMAYDTLTSLGYKVYDLGAISNIDLPKE